MSTSTDFFADLERQLVDAARERPRRVRRARARRAAVLASGVAVAAAAAATVVLAVPHDGTVRDRPAARLTTTARPAAPGDATVAVLNGTTTPGLARGVAMRLQQAGGVRIGTVTNASTQSHRATQVYFAPRPIPAVPQAERVASVLTSARPVRVRPMPPAIAALVGAEADVVVVVGSDQGGSAATR
jgi:hypothetical protein